MARVVRHVVPLLAAGLVIALTFPSCRRRLGPTKATAALATLAVVAAGSYALGYRSSGDGYVNGWEFFHYYLGAKYAPELGYTGLYAAALVADVETGRQFRHERDAIRDLNDGTCIPVDDVLHDRESVLARFSSDRWAEFVKDTRYFKDALSPSRWNGVFRDKGYNATPVWTMIASPLASRVPTANPAGLLGLSLLDPALLILALVAVWRTFGARTALLMVVLIGTHMAMSHSHMKGAFLRTLWVSSLVLGVCAVKTARPAVGGALVALAAAARVFPALFALGLLAAPWIPGPQPQGRRREQLRFASGFVVALVLVIAASALATPPGTWQGFTDKIWQHHDSFSPWRVGFKHLFLGAYEYRAEGLATHQEVFHERRVLWWAIQASVLAGFVWLTRRLESWEILALGFIPTFFLVAPTYYYYIMLVVPLLFFCERIPRPECTLGVVWLLASSSIAYFVEDAVGRELPLFWVLSATVLLTCMLMAYSAHRERRPRAQRETARDTAYPIVAIPDDVLVTPAVPRRRLTYGSIRRVCCRGNSG